MFDRGTEVIAARNLGIDVPKGSFGVVQEAHLLGDHTVEFFPGGLAHGVRSGDLTPASSGPWWMQPSAPTSTKESAPNASSSSLPSGAGAWTLRVVIAAVIVIGCAYGITAWT